MIAPDWTPTTTPAEEARVTHDAETLQTAAGLATTHPDVPEHLRGPLSDLFRAAARDAVEVGADYRTVALARALLDPPDSWRLDAVEHGPSETANIGGGYLCLCGAPVPCGTAGVAPEPAVRPAVRVADGLAGAGAPSGNPNASGATSGPSPEWIAEYLETAGVTPYISGGDWRFELTEPQMLAFAAAVHQQAGGVR